MSESKTILGVKELTPPLRKYVFRKKKMCYLYRSTFDACYDIEVYRFLANFFSE